MVGLLAMLQVIQPAIPLAFITLRVHFSLASQAVIHQDLYISVGSQSVPQPVLMQEGG